MEKKIQDLVRLSFSLRKEILTMIYQAGSGHPAGSLSCLDILIALYFGGILQKQDRFLLSAGHYCPALYAVLAEAGFFSKEKLNTLRKFGSPLQGHPEKERIAGVEISSGLLGQGLSIGVGMALSTGNQYHVFVLMSDAEHQEGQVWEAAMAAAKYKLGNLVAIVDRNQIQIDGETEEIMPLGSLAEKYQSFGWRTLEIDGHDFPQLLVALRHAKEELRQPLAIIANTIAGKGVLFMEGQPAWHGRGLTKEELKKAINSLEKNYGKS